MILVVQGCIRNYSRVKLFCLIILCVLCTAWGGSALIVLFLINGTHY